MLAVTERKGGQAGILLFKKSCEQAFCLWTEPFPALLASPGRPGVKCIIYEDEPMHIHELTAFQGQLLSVKNPRIMNYCVRGGPGFSLQSSKLL